MQIRGKILTLAGIILIFGYFIMDAVKSPSALDPNTIVIVGGDTLGRDWGAAADRAEQQKLQDESGDQANAGELKAPSSLISPENDPYQRDKINSDNYTTIESGDGREIITGYNRPEEEDNGDNYKTRHQKEVGEPTMIYRE